MRTLPDRLFKSSSRAARSEPKRTTRRPFAQARRGTSCSDTRKARAQHTLTRPG